jgi:hypothetical protein
MPYQQGPSTVTPAPHTELQRVWKQPHSPGHTTNHFRLQQVVGTTALVRHYQAPIGAWNYVSLSPQFMPV